MKWVWTHIPSSGNRLGLDLQSLKSKAGSRLDGARSPREEPAGRAALLGARRKFIFAPSMLCASLCPHSMVRSLGEASSRKALQASADLAAFLKPR